MPKIMPLIWAGRAVAVTLVASSLAAAGESAGDLHFLPPML